jgi:hypothetical protein|tara:strand:+ start:1176 stop:1766 length:591 start_codon:yes stop_codon:yes gene_type:complete
MQSLFEYIISTENRYNNTVDVEGKELVVNTEVTERDYMFVNRIGKIVKLPLYNNSELKENDEVIVHHNVFRRWIDVEGIQKNSSSFLNENEYLVSDDQIFAYRRNNKWKSLPNFCFVKPLYKKDKWALKTDENLLGILTYSNDKLNQLGVSVGDVVGFTPDSEYEFNIEGEKLYRIFSHHITIKYGTKERQGYISC